MFENLEIFRMSAAMATHAGQRQAVTAQNMAHVDTPGFQARRLASFAELTSSADRSASGGFAGRASRTGHLYGTGAATIHASVTLEKTGAAPDGNTVSIDREMLESVDARREHDRALAIYKSALKVLHTTLARS